VCCGAAGVCFDAGGWVGGERFFERVSGFGGGGERQKRMVMKALAAEESSSSGSSINFTEKEQQYVLGYEIEKYMSQESDSRGEDYM